MNNWTQTLHNGFFTVMPKLLLIIQVVALAHAADQSPKTGQPLDQASPGRVAVAASLGRDIRTVDAMMTAQGPVLLTDLKWLKWMGYLCRRTKTDIEREIAKAQANMAELQLMRQSGYLDAARARLIAYALGMEADALAKQAIQLEAALAPAGNDASSADAEIMHAIRKQQQAVRTLSTMSSVLHELAKAIVVNL